MADSTFYAKYSGLVAGGSGVTTINGLSGAVTLAAGTGISITPSGNTLTIASTSAGDVTFAPVGAVPNANGASISGSQVITLQPANTSFPGVLTAADWNTFNGKQNALTIGNISDAGTDGIIVTGGTGAIIGSGVTLSQHVADATHNGYLSSTDWSTFNGKQASGNYITALTGDVTASGPGSVAATIANNVVTNAKLAQMATLTIKGNNTGGTANALDLTVAQVNAILPVFTSTLNGLAPLSGGGSTNFLRADGTWAAPTGTNTGTVTSVAMTVPTFLSISGSPITTSGTLAVTLSGTALPLANGGTGQTTKAAAFDALQPMTTGGDIIYGGASGTGTRLANGSAGQYLKSAGGTSAPTWSTFAVPTIQKFTSSSGTYTTPAGALYLRVRMVGGGGGGASTTGTTGGQNGTASTFGTSLLTANPGGGTSSTVGGAGGSNSGAISAPAYGTAISGATGNYGANLASTSGGSGASSALGGAGFGGNINASGGAAVANTGSGGGGGGGTIGGGSEGGGGAGVYIDAIVPSPSATYSYTVGAGGAGGTGGDVGGNGGSGYIEVTEYYS